MIQVMTMKGPSPAMLDNYKRSVSILSRDCGRSPQNLSADEISAWVDRPCGGAMTDHDASGPGRTREAVLCEQIRKIVGAQLKQFPGPAHRHEAIPDAQPDDFNE